MNTVADFWEMVSKYLVKTKTILFCMNILIEYKLFSIF